MNEKNELLNKLHRLKQEHRDLDEVLIQLQEKHTVNFSQIQRLKKRKLILKDQIAQLRNKTEPDIIDYKAQKFFELKLNKYYS